eukprot:COSAG06_NODE_556_length_14336_cov_8.683290_18_plen_135_part_00
MIDEHRIDSHDRIEAEGPGAGPRAGNLSNIFAKSHTSQEDGGRGSQNAINALSLRTQQLGSNRIGHFVSVAPAVGRASECEEPPLRAPRSRCTRAMMWHSSRYRVHKWWMRLRWSTDQVASAYYNKTMSRTNEN